MKKRRHFASVSAETLRAQIEKAQDFLDEKALAPEQLEKAVRFAHRRWLEGMSEAAAVALASERFAVAQVAIEIEFQRKKASS